MSTNEPHDYDLDTGDDRIIGVAFKWSLIAVAVLLLIGFVLFWVTREKKVAETIINREPVAAPDVLVQEQGQRPEVRFTDIGQETGITFVHTSGATGEKLLPETMGGGVAFFDPDGDGDEDLLFVNSRNWPHQANPNPPTMAFYRNQAGTFSDATKEVGLDVSLYGMGVAVGDIDSDGDPDLFISALGSNRLFRNDQGIFTDITQSSGVAGDEDAWSTSSGFFDADNDGDLDLFVCNYVLWSREIDIELAFSINGRDRAYGPPKLYRGTHSQLYFNQGDGVFVDVSESAGIQVNNPATGNPMGKSLAVTFVDIDRDGFMDIFVANDTIQNFLFKNLGDGRFEEFGASSGVAFDGMGSATGAMGIDVADYRNDGFLGIGIGNFANENTSFYVQQQRDPWQFAEMSNAVGIGSPSRLKLSFGLLFLDYDLDGNLDVAQANGHLENEINEVQPSQHYLQPAQLFWNRGKDATPTFAEVPSESLGDFAKPIVGRGAAMADIDNDGDLDVVFTQTGGPPLLLRNEQATGNSWLRVKLKGTKVNPSAIGSWVELETNGQVQRQQVMPARSYLSQVPLSLTFGLGKAEKISRLEVIWSNGQRQIVTVEGLNREILITQD